VVDEQHDDLAAQFVALNGGQAAKGVDQIVGQLRRNLRLFRSVIHSFSPLRVDPAKQMSFALSKSSQSHAQYPSAPLRKTCAWLESLSCCAVWRFGTRLHTESTWRFGTRRGRKKRMAFNNLPLRARRLTKRGQRFKERRLLQGERIPTWSERRRSAKSVGR